MSRVLAFLCASLVASIALAQTVYEPVRYQHGRGSMSFYYGGSNPHFVHWAHVQEVLEEISLRRDGPFGRHDLYARLFNPHVRVYSDLLPYRDASLIGFTADHARLEAMGQLMSFYQNYADDSLSASPRPQIEGSVVVVGAAPQRHVNRARAGVVVIEHKR